MSKIFVVMGKSATGKDTIYKTLAQDGNLKLKEIISYTTRPIRKGEKNGVEYHFVTEEKMNALKQEGKVIEHRSYHTVHGVWHYFTVDDDQVQIEKENYIIIGTLESYMQMVKYFGAKNVVPIYIEVENGERLTRALKREKKQEHPKYEEMCRRFLADEEDFSVEKLKQAGIEKRFRNRSLPKCIREVRTLIFRAIK